MSSNQEKTPNEFIADIESANETTYSGIDSIPEHVKVSAIRLMQLITEEDCTEIMLNGPDEVAFKKAGQRFIREDIKFHDTETYHQVINEVILPNTNTTDRIKENSFVIQGQLDLPYKDISGLDRNILARVHIIAPPASDAAVVTIAKKAKQQFTLNQLAEKGTMSLEMAHFLEAASKGKLTIVLSGLSGSGKTTQLEVLSGYFDHNDRVIVVEDTPELILPTDDIVYLKSTNAKPGSGKTSVSLEWLVSEANRMRADRIIVGEIRGSEMLEFLSAANSGMEGSMTTLHASSPRQAIDKMVSLCMKSTNAKSDYSVVRDISSTIHLIVQTALIDGKHIISAIEEVSNIVRKESGVIATSTLFAYNRNANKFERQNNPSDELVSFLGQRGILLPGHNQ